MMENRSSEQQIWERVLKGQEEQPRSDLRQLQLAAMELAGIYRHLAGTLAGRQREMAKELYEGEMETARCLKGASILAGRKEDVLTIWTPAKEPARKLLEKCYHQTRRCLVDYTARSAEPELGAIFQQLAKKAAQRCARIAQLLGML